MRRRRRALQQFALVPHRVHQLAADGALAGQGRFGLGAARVVHAGAAQAHGVAAGVEPHPVVRVRKLLEEREQVPEGPALGERGLDLLAGLSLEHVPAQFRRQGEVAQGEVLARGRGVRGPHDWDHHWAIARAARRIYGAWKVNFHVIVGLGETDEELVDLFCGLKEEEIAAYLFSFNPEPV